MNRNRVCSPLKDLLNSDMPEIMVPLKLSVVKFDQLVKSGLYAQSAVGVTRRYAYAAPEVITMLRGNPNFLILLSSALEHSFCGAQPIQH